MRVRGPTFGRLYQRGSSGRSNLNRDIGLTGAFHRAMRWGLDPEVSCAGSIQFAPAFGAGSSVEIASVVRPGNSGEPSA